MLGQGADHQADEMLRARRTHVGQGRRMTIAHGPAEAARHPVQWWEYRWTVIALVLLCALPLTWPDIPPLVDLPGHMGRYRVQLDLASSPELQAFYTFDWAIIGNLGVDLIVQALGPIFGIEPVVKAVVIAIPALTAAGLLWVAREVHGRVRRPRCSLCPSRSTIRSCSAS
jgi:hypothetical protein